MRATWVSPLIGHPRPAAVKQKVEQKMTRHEIAVFARSCRPRDERVVQRQEKIIEALREAGESGATYREVVAATQESVRAILNSLATLEEAGVVSRKAVGFAEHRPRYESRIGSTKPQKRPCAIWWLKEFVDVT